MSVETSTPSNTQRDYKEVINESMVTAVWMKMVLMQMDDDGVDVDALASSSQALSSYSMDGGGDAMVVMAVRRRQPSERRLRMRMDLMTLDVVC